jgi:threonine synthase
MLSQFEGVFCEPASATSLAGALNDIGTGKIPEGSRIVCTLTGNGIKDPEIAMQQCADTQPVTIDASLDAVKRAILDNL